MPRIEGVLCDLDGTLVDSEPSHLNAWNILIERDGHTPPSPHWNDDCIGLPDTYARDKTYDTFPDMRAKYPNLLEMKQEAFRELIARLGEKLAYPGVAEQLERLRLSGVKLAVGTNSVMVNTRASLTASGLLRFFPVIVTLDTVTRGKPDPEIYRTAAEKLGLAPERCAVLEDSTAGLASGKAAGCLVLGITNTWKASALTDAEKTFDSTAAAMDWIIEENKRFP